MAAIAIKGVSIVSGWLWPKFAQAAANEASLMKKLIIAIIVLLCIVPCWATTHIMYMTPGGAGNMSGISPANAASDFYPIIIYSWSFEPNAVIDVIMASGTFTISVNQHFDLAK